MPSSDQASFLRTIGSLWLAAVLLALLVVSFGAATVYESWYGTDQAKFAFYHSRWLTILMAILVINIVAAVAARAPFNRQQVGFLITHLAIILIFVGAYVTYGFSDDGHLSIAENETADSFQLPDRPVFSIIDQAGKGQAHRTLDPRVFAGFEQAANPLPEQITCGDLRVEIRRYLPNAEESRTLIDHQPDGQPAIDAAVVSDQHDFHSWIFAGESDMVGPLTASFRQARSADELGPWMSTTAPAEAASKGTVKLEIEGQTYALPLEQCQDQAAAVGSTGYSVRVTRYYPHAVVGPDKTLTNASAQPVNPYIEAELTGPSGTESRRSFARFPDFDNMHGTTTARAVTVHFEAPEGQFSETPIEILAGQDGRHYARFSKEGTVVSATTLEMNKPVDTPWEGWKLVIRGQREGAKWQRTLEPITKVDRQGRQQALELTLRSPEGEKNAWVFYGQPELVKLGRQSYELQFDAAKMDLGFSLKLDGFRVVTHPGTDRPRSFESRVTVTDPRAGGESSWVIRMNNPLAYGGFNFYQSSYQREGKSFISVLGVARDPGRPIVYAGYFTLLLGLLWVLAKRMRERKDARPGEK